MAKEQNEAERDKQIAKNRKAASDAADKQRSIPAKKGHNRVSQATAPSVEKRP
jgi:hypothetical protein